MTQATITPRAAKPARRAHGAWLRPVAVITGILVVWQLVVLLGLVPSMTPGVVEVAIATVQQLGSPIFWGALWQTMSAAFIGWVIACVSATIIGILVGSIPFLRTSSSVLLDFGRSFPTLALIPVVILLLGASQPMKIWLVVLTCFWPVVIQAVQGAKRIDPLVMDMAQTYKVSWLRQFTFVRLPSALPFIATGVRIAASMAVLVAVGAEVLSQAQGLGRQITLAQQAQHWDDAFAYLFFAGLFGWLVNVALQLAEKRMLRWNRLTEQ